MAKVSEEEIDSLILAENIGFLDNYFDNSFVLQSSLVAVKEYVAEEQSEFSNDQKIQITCKKRNCSLQNNTLSLDASTCNKSLLSQCTVKTNVLNKNLKDWGLPLEIASKYEQRGITEMFDWQVTCLRNPKVLLDCRNLVYSAPTSAGKTLVAEILTIKTILERQKKVIIILPFVSIVREKMFYLQDILSSSGIRVEGFMGSQSPPGGLQAVHVAICTIEKANSLVNKLLDEGNISELGAVIVDELHLLGDPHRGYILELLLTKIKYVTMKSNDVLIQIVGMSATLPNLEVLAEWLEAELYITQFRPIPLDEFCLVGNKFYDKQGIHITSIDNIKMGNDECDNVLKICLETIRDGCSILIFCMTKNRCENLAQSISSSFYKLGCNGCEFGVVLRNQLKCESILEVLEQLKNCPVGLDAILQKTISFGVAYHHAGLTFDERDIIEGGFKSGAIRVLVATSTLSSGVNLPARKVIVRSPVFLRQPINILTYKQMVGRAGRMGKDSKGESILICTEAEKKIGFELMMGALNPVKSCIESEDKYMRAVLEMIASQVLCTKAELELYAKCTLLFTQQTEKSSQNFLLEDTLKELKNFELVRNQNDDEENRYVATPLGKACLSSSMAPNDGLSLFCELQKARQCLVLETDLHLIYLVTPYSVSSQWGDSIDWLHLLTLWESLTKAMKRVGELVGVQESFIIRCLRGTNKLNNAQNKLNIHKRFYTALALQDLVNEVPLSEVAKKFQCARGFLQGLQQAAATFAGMVTAFCRQLGWKNMEMLIAQFQDRLHFGIHSELLEIMKLPSLNGTRARALFDSGFDTISSIASAASDIIENILHKAVPFQSEKERDGDDTDDMRKRNKIKNIWVTGCCGMTAKEAAENLVTEARKYLEHELGISDIKWNKKKANCDNAEGSNTENEMNGSEYSSTQCVKQDNGISKIKNNDLLYIKAEIITQIKIDSNTLSSPSENSENVFNITIADAITTIKDENVIENKINTRNKKKDTLTQNHVHTENISIAKEENEIILENTKNKKCVNVKDEIIWDSLNFTEAAFENISKVQTTDKAFSPNISFGDTEDKFVPSVNISDNTALSKCTSVKDVSLFSSDGDNSSLFDESLPLELIPSKLIDNKNEPITVCKHGTTDYVSINTNSILNAFKSTLIEIDDDDEDIKLVYEEDNGLNENVRDSSGINHTKDIEVEDTQVVNETFDNLKFQSPFKRQLANKIDAIQPSPKKKKIETIFFHKTDRSFKVPASKITCAPSSNILISINTYKINCYSLRGNEIVENLHVVENLQAASIYLCIKSTNLATNELIGSNILKVPKTPCKDLNEERFAVKGMAICFGKSTCIYMDLSSVGGMLRTVKDRIRRWLKRKSLKLTMLSLKTYYTHIKRWLGTNLPLPCVDISIAEWLTNSDEKIPNIIYLAKKYCETDLNIPIKVGNQHKKFQNLDTFEDLCVRAYFVRVIADKQQKYLTERYISVRETIDIETQVSKILSDCEFYGITVDKNLASRLLIDVKNSQDILQKKAYKLCGHHFNFNSSKDVAKVLGMYKGSKVSTKKSVLTTHNSPISSIIIYWRKLNSILTKTLYPLTEKACIYSEGDRINPSYTMYTCTGRISMHEPNLQNVPRTFSIPAQYLSMKDDICDGDVIEFNCRNIFRVTPGFVIVSADYCQLEMRILTHYSKDPVLMGIMCSNADVFKSIAASWSNVPENQVDDDLRQKAKQLCYGILYGMGNRTLAQHLDVSETEAAVFMDSFYKTYPAVKEFTASVVVECRKKEYVETLKNRRRYLPDINSNVASKRSAAERQAVNTTIQGSAADIAKAAMCAIDNKTNLHEPKPRLILQMHDELIYEVPENNRNSFIAMMKDVMEDTVRLNVPLPVKVKCGYTWGTLE